MYFEVNVKQLKLLLFVQLLCMSSVMFLLIQERELAFSYAFTSEQFSTLMLSSLGICLLVCSYKFRYLKSFLIGLNILGMSCACLILSYLFYA